MHICSACSVAVTETVMVGDSVDDILAGSAAGAATVLVGDAGGEAAALADYRCATLREVQALLEGLATNEAEAGPGGVGQELAC